MDLLFIVFFVSLAGFFVFLGSWKQSATVVLFGVVFLFFANVLVLGNSVEVVNGSSTSWVDYSAITNETAFGLNTTIYGSKLVGNTYYPLSDEIRMSIVTVLTLLCFYLLYLVFQRYREPNEY